MMKICVLIALSLVFFTKTTFGQTNWLSIENVLYTQYEKHELTGSEWTLKLHKDAGYFDRLSLWVEAEKALPTIDKKVGLKLYFLKDYQVVSANGNKYAKLNLENHSNDSIAIARIDATLDYITEYFLIKGKWVPFRKNGKSTCGNSYFQSKIAPHQQLSLALNNYSLYDGNQKVKYKITIQIAGQIVESNVIEVSLFKNQLKRLTESISNKTL